MANVAGQKFRLRLIWNSRGRPGWIATHWSGVTCGDERVCDKRTGSSRNYLGRNVVRQSAEFGVWLVGDASRENVGVGMLYSGNRLGSLLRTATTMAAAQHYLDIGAQTEPR